MTPEGGRPHVLFAAISVGNGHRMAAEAGARWLEAEAPGRFERTVVDFTSEVGDHALDRRHKRSWRWMLRWPWTAYWGQRLVDDLVPSSWSRAVQSRMMHGHARSAARWLADRDDALIVCTHFFTAHALSVARRRHGLATPVVVVNPDAMDAHALWAAPDLDGYVVYGDAAARDLARHGVPEARIHVVPPLLRPEFLGPAEDADRGAARRELELPTDGFVALWSAGGEGIGGPLPEVVRRWPRAGRGEADRPVTIVALCGRNERSRRRLERLASEAPPGLRLLPLGFRDDVRRLLAASDVVVGKAGPASTLEALISGRPVLFTGFAAANEKAVVDAVLAAGAGTLERRPAAIASLLDRWAADPEATAALRNGVARMEVRNGGPEFARLLLDRFLAVA